MKELGRSIQNNGQNTRSLIRALEDIQAVADGRSFYGERV